MIGYFFSCFLCLICISCGETSGPLPPVIEPPEAVEVFETQWETSLNATKEIVGSDFTQFYGDWVLVTGDIDDPFTLMAFNSVTGNKDWTYFNAGMVIDEILTSQVYENLYIAITNKGMVAVNLDSQILEWEIPFHDLKYESNNGNVVHNGYLYHNFSVGGVGLSSEAAAIVRINLGSGTYEELWRENNDNKGLKSNSPPIIYTSDNGHEIMIFNHRPNAGISPPEVKQEMVSYDITEGQELWRIDVTDTYASNGLHPPIIYDNIVITGGDWSMYGFDIQTGEQLWKTSMPGYTQWGIWTKTNHLLKDDRLYVNEGGHQLHCLNPLDGSFIWQNLEDAPNCTDNMIYYEKEDYLVYTSWGLGSIMIVDALTGELIHRERSEDSTYNNDPVYDPETDMFFTSTYKNAVGFKVNRPE